jgi:hypothetical protein
MTETHTQPSCFTFEAYVPEYVADDGTPMMHNVRHQVQSRDMTLGALLEAFENFLRGAGYAAQLRTKYIDLVDIERDEHASV